MAEFCLECWNKLNETQDSKWRYSLSRNRELCEECGQYKRVVVVERLWSRVQRGMKEVIDNIQNERE